MLKTKIYLFRVQRSDRSELGMQKIQYLSLILFLCFQISNINGQNVERSTNYFSVGILDHKTGFSWVGYAHTFKQNEKHDLFVGAGSLIFFHTVSVGWKYYLIDAPIKAYSVLAIHGIIFKNILKGKPFMSIGIEKKLTEKLYFNLGINSTLDENTSSPTIYWAPSINVNWRLE